MRIDKRKSDIINHVNREFFSEDEVIEAYKKILNSKTNF